MNVSAFRKTVIACSAAVLIPGLAAGQPFSAWGTAVPVGEVNSPVGDGCPIEAPDGLHLYFASTRSRGIDNDIWVAERASKDASWNEPEKLDPPVNSDANDFCPTPLPGKWLLFVSERTGEETCNAGPGSGDMYLIRDNPGHGWGEPQHLGCAESGSGPNTNGPEFSPSLVEADEGVFLYYSSNGGSGSQDIYVSRLGDDGRFGPGTVVTELSTPDDDRMPNVSKDGREIVFSSNRPTWGGGQSAEGGQDVYRATRENATGVWSDPENLGDAVNTAGDETRASMSRDGERLYFGRSGDIHMSVRYRLTGSNQ